ncbi:sensor histidine kinase [Actinomadura fibrosa]|uniref:histidine kinase n=1 Tax=Actinomadura fibrosa TaxID=111802 RepID=A0ABW2XMN0_9ACTN|nr:histidine kinase [Actinomadura fibrosa]
MKERGSQLDRIHSAGGCLARAGYGGFAALYLLGCLLAGSRDPASLWTACLAAAASAGAVSTRRRLVAWAAGVAVLSALSTLFLATAIQSDFAGQSALAELGGLLVLLTRTVWRIERDRLVAIAVLLGTAVLIVPLRWSVVVAVLFTAPLGILVAVALGIGLYLRAVDARRARSLAAARRDERLELARDLHDFVAHHVTGIVVQAQAARFAARSGAGQSPEQLDTMFAGIETAGTEALTSMRRMVGLLRDAQNVNARDGDARNRDARDGDARDPGATRRGGVAAARDGGGPATRPVGDLEQVRELVEGFTHPPAALALAPGLEPLPPEVAASVHRVVQEALTNIRKHAADAKSVQVAVARAGDAWIEVAVRDDGRGRGRRLPSGGYGLTGLSERVGALGGRLYAGPRPGGGWEVVAALPVRGARES